MAAVKCRACNGAKKQEVRVRHWGRGGFSYSYEKCPVCRGKGTRWMSSNACRRRKLL